MIRSTLAWGAAAVAVTALAEAAAGVVGLHAAVDAATALAFLLLALAVRREATGYAVLAAASGLTWLLAGPVPELSGLHRPLLVWTVLGYPDGRLRDPLRLSLVVAAGLSAVCPPEAVPALLAATGVGLAAVGVQELARRRPGGRVAAQARAGAALVLAVAFLVPAARSLVLPGPAVTATAVEMVYATLLAAAGAGLLVSALAGQAEGEANAVVALAEAEGTEATLVSLRAQLAPSGAGRRGGDSGARSVRSAVTLLEHNQALHRALDDAVQRQRLSRRRLADSTVLERRALRRRLTERALPLLPQLDDLLFAVRTADPTARRLLAGCRAEVAGLGADLDNLAQGLHPAGLSERGLAALADLELSSPVPVRTCLPDRRYPAEAEVALWYACTEAVVNAVKHAGAGCIRVEVREHDGTLRAEIRDDGCGGARPVGGGGLAGLRDRLTAVDGRLTVHSRPGGGTTVQVQVPTS